MTNSSDTQNLKSSKQKNRSQAERDSDTPQPAPSQGQPEHEREDFEMLLDEVGDSVARYCRKRPVMASLAVFAAGFYVGWKVKPW